MQKKYFILVFMLVLFLLFYSGYYYLSMNMGDEMVQLDHNHPANVHFTLDVTPQPNINTFAFPFAEMQDETARDTDAASHTLQRSYLSVFRKDNAWTMLKTPLPDKLKEITLPPSWTSVTEQNDPPPIYRLSRRDALRFMDNFYVRNTPVEFVGTPVRMLIGRPGHRGEAAILYKPESGNIAHLASVKVPGSDHTLVLFSLHEKKSLRKAWQSANKLMDTNEGTTLTGNHQLQFPLMYFETYPAFSEGWEGDTLAYFTGRLRISAAQNDMSLLPSRRFPAGEADDPDVWTFDQPFYFFVKENGSELPVFMAYFANPSAFQQVPTP